MAKSCNFFSSSLLFLPLVFSFFLTPTSSQNIHPSDLAALQQIKNSLTDIPTSAVKFFSTWNFSGDNTCTSFSGVTCNFFNRVTILELGTGLSDSVGLAGTLSPAIAQLTELNQIILFSGIVTGQIPSSLGLIQSLRVISLSNNRLTGSIPYHILSLPNLHTLDLSHNELTGSIPHSLTGLNQLKVLILAGNRFTGQIPQILPSNILHVDLSYNLFTGNLPGNIPVTIRYISLSNNRMWGPISTLQPLIELSYVDLSMNHFSGPIPAEVFHPCITSMLLQRNNLSGGVPDLPPVQYGVGSTIDLSHNSLTGELPNTLQAVESLFLNNNKFTGTVPEGYGDSVRSGGMKTLYLQHNYFTGFPMEVGTVLPDTVSVCVSYNCMTEPPVGLAACPASAGDQLSRPAYQCSSSGR